MQTFVLLKITHSHVRVNKYPTQHMLLAENDTGSGMKTLLVGDRTQYISDAAKQIDPGATLLTEHNYKSLTDGTFYISQGDFSSVHDFAEALWSADKLIYFPPTVWSDTDSNNCSVRRKWTEYLLSSLINKKIVENTHLFSPDTLHPSDDTAMLKLSDGRKTNSKQLWAVGCSFTAGDGIEKNQRWGQLVSNMLDLPVSFLAESGSSITWAADQILRSDIGKDDIVIWGLTCPARFPYFQKELIHVHVFYYQSHPEFNNTINIDRLDDDNMTYITLTKVHQVINFCNKIGANLILCGFMIDVDLVQYFTKLPNYICYTEILNRPHEGFTLLDRGSDGWHPGPLTHKMYSHDIVNLVKQNNW